MPVELAAAVSELLNDDTMSTPGAKRSTHGPKLAQVGFASEDVVALTVMAGPTRAGEKSHASCCTPAWFPLPAATE